MRECQLPEAIKYGANEGDNVKLVYESRIVAPDALLVPVWRWRRAAGGNRQSSREAVKEINLRLMNGEWGIR